MKKEKKPKHDTVPEIYMVSSDAAFFRQNYPVDSEQCTIDAVPDSAGKSNWDNDGDMRVEHNL